MTDMRTCAGDDGLMCPGTAGCFYKNQNQLNPVAIRGSIDCPARYVGRRADRRAFIGSTRPDIGAINTNNWEMSQRDVLGVLCQIALSAASSWPHSSCSHFLPFRRQP